VFLATRMMLEHHIFKISVNSSPVVSQVTTLTRSRARRLSMYHFFGIRALSHFSRTEFVGLSSANLILVHQSAKKLTYKLRRQFFLPAALLENIFDQEPFPTDRKERIPRASFFIDSTLWSFKGICSCPFQSLRTANLLERISLHEKIQLKS